MKYIKYYLWFVVVELFLLFSFGCSAPRERRGDWMEHMNYKQFDFKPIIIHWDRHHYFSEEEIKEIWAESYNIAQENISKRIEDIYKRSNQQRQESQGKVQEG